MNKIYKPEITGLRAVAVAALIFYNAQISFSGFNLFPGGFIGIDLFFFISGYLITNIILDEIKTKGTFSFKNFYEKRIINILPTLLFVIFTSFIFAWIYYLPTNFVQFLKSIITSISFSSNFYFHYSGNAFGEPNTFFKPLNHTWALSILVQFYILFPIFLYLCLKYLRDYLINILFLGFLISLVFATFESKNNPSASYYFIQARIWEFLAGSILNYFHTYRNKNYRYKKIYFILPTIGLFFIVYSFINFNDKILHPSYLTLLPIIGIYLIIFFSHKNELITKLLSSKLFFWSGLISFSLFLWHFPIFAFARSTGFIEDNFFRKLLVGFIILILSIFTYCFFERKNRSTRLKFRSVLIRVIPSLFLIFITSIYLIKQNINLVIKSGDNGILMSNNQLIGNGDTKFIIFGDSHATHIMSYLKDVSESKNISFFNVTHNACISLPNLTNFYNPNKEKMSNYKPREECINLYKNVENILKEQDDEILVVFYNTWFKDLIRNNTLIINDKLWFKKDLKHNEELIKLILNDIIYLRKKNNIKKKWILVGKNPGSYNNKYGGFLKCFNANKKFAHKKYDDNKNCKIKGKKENGTDYQNNILFKNLIKEKKYNNDLIYIDSYDLLCDEEYCYNLDENNNLIYKDHGHFTYEGSKIISNKLLDIINQVNLIK